MTFHQAGDKAIAWYNDEPDQFFIWMGKIMNILEFS